jgi:hypothetical protein
MTVFDPHSIRTPIREDFPRVTSMNNPQEFVGLITKELRKRQNLDTNSVTEIGVIVPIKPASPKESDITLRDDWIKKLNQGAPNHLRFCAVEGIFLASVLRAGTYFLKSSNTYLPSISFTTEHFAQKARDRFFVLCDDYYYMGGTFAALYHAVVQHGGHVLAASADEKGGFMGGLGNFAPDKCRWYTDIFGNNMAEQAAKTAKVDAILKRNLLALDVLTGDELMVIIGHGFKEDAKTLQRRANFEHLLEKLEYLVPKEPIQINSTSLLMNLRNIDLSERSRADLGLK